MGELSLGGRAGRTLVQGPRSANSSGRPMPTGAPAISGDGHVANHGDFGSEFVQCRGVLLERDSVLPIGPPAPSKGEGRQAREPEEAGEA